MRNADGNRDRPNLGRAHSVPVVLGADLWFGSDINGNPFRVTGHLLSFPENADGTTNAATHVIWPNHTTMGTLNKGGSSVRVSVTDTVATIQSAFETLGVTVDRLTVTPRRWIVQEADSNDPQPLDITSTGGLPTVINGPRVTSTVDVASAIEMFDQSGGAMPIASGTLCDASPSGVLKWSVDRLAVLEESRAGLAHQIRLHGSPSSGTLDITYSIPVSGDVLGAPYATETITWPIGSDLKTALNGHSEINNPEVWYDSTADAYRIDLAQIHRNVPIPPPSLDFSSMPSGTSATAHFVG